MEILKDFVIYYGGWQAVIIAVITFFFIRFAERIKIKWEKEANEKIEKLKGEIQKELTLSASLLSNSLYGHQKFTDKRIISLDLLWKSVLELQKIVNPVYVYFQILTDEEIENKNFSDMTIREINTYNSDEKIDEIDKLTEALNESRPYIGEKLFYIYSVYRTTLIRSMRFLSLQNSSEKIMLWHKDKAIRSLVESLYSNDEIEKIIAIRIGTLNALKTKFENDILQEISNAMKGSDSISEGIENYSKLQSELQRYEKN
jgi:hypothetical protein